MTTVEHYVKDNAQLIRQLDQLEAKRLVGEIRLRAQAYEWAGRKYSPELLKLAIRILDGKK